MFLVRTWVDVPFRTGQRDAGVPMPSQDSIANTVRTRRSTHVSLTGFVGVTKLVLGRSARSLTSGACNKTCLNGGQCYLDAQHGGEARCSCPNDFYGSQCERGKCASLIFRMAPSIVI